MADVATVSAKKTKVTVPKKTTTAKIPKTTAAVKKPKVPADHPMYIEMTVKTVQALKEQKGSSRQAILKYIMINFNVGGDAKMVNNHLKQALKRGVTAGQLKLAKGVGAAGRFRLGEKKPTDGKKKVAKPKDTGKPKVAKSKSLKRPKAASVKKSVASASKPKKAVNPKKIEDKSPKKTVASKEPKTKTSPKKKAAPKKIVIPKATKKIAA